MLGRLIVVAFVTAHCAATTIVLIRTPDRLIVGADSLMVEWQNVTNSQAIYACKLHKERSIFFAISGMGVVYSGTNFSAEHLIRDAISSSHSIKEAATQFMHTSTVPYARVVKAMRTADPYGWQLIRQYHGGGITLAAIFFGLERGVPTYVIVGFRVSTGPITKVSADIASCPGRACEDSVNGEAALVLGESNAAYHQIGGEDQNSFKKFRHAIGDLHTVKQLIALEAVAVPHAVGGPVHIVTLDAGGEHWDAAAGICK